jgi:hypothetical protein
MRRAPGLNATDVDRATEVVQVGRLGSPALLALRFAHLLTRAGRAIPLALTDAPIRSEVKAAVQAVTERLNAATEERLKCGHAVGGDSIL